ncbi:MAG: tyrosine-type recombinase/integrase [Hyphomicrobiales bacterium]
MRSKGKLDAVFAAAAGAYSPATIRGYRADLATFEKWCAQQKCSVLPARSGSIALFVNEQIERHAVSTIKRRLCAIAFAHRMRDLPLPTDANSVRLALRRAVRKRASRPKQVRGLTNVIRRSIIKACPKSLAGVRDAALISVGYDTLCRSSELAAMRVEHLRFEAGNAGSVLIPRSKSDVSGQGRIAYLSPQTASLLRRWIAMSGISTGPLFRSLHLQRLYDGPLTTSSIRRLIKRATQRAGLPPSVAAELSGHSMRIGAAQDMLVAGFDALAIMQAGGWKSANVVLRYVENASTKELHIRRWKAIGSRVFGEIA